MSEPKPMKIKKAEQPDPQPEPRPVGRPPKEVSVRDLRLKLLEAQEIAQKIIRMKAIPSVTPIININRTLSKMIKIAEKRDTGI